MADSQKLSAFSFDSVLIKVPGEPVAWARPRAKVVSPRFGKPFAQFYTLKEMEDYKNKIQAVALRIMGHHPALDETCEAEVRAYLPVPESYSGKKTTACLQGEIKPRSTPDVDNYAKIAMDACNGIVFRDDALVWRITSEKHYSQEPRLEIVIRRYEPPRLL